MWTQEEAVFEGKYYQVRGAINQPKGSSNRISPYSSVAAKR
jgi:alkanesulfonate monooxygenase SsuD/methylene tetrahydromethanopterin reductase-like flavin-dependent oxidoreductase (luciferase family)